MPRSLGGVALGCIAAYACADLLGSLVMALAAVHNLQEGEFKGSVRGRLGARRHVDARVQSKKRLRRVTLLACAQRQHHLRQQVTATWSPTQCIEGGQHETYWCMLTGQSAPLLKRSLPSGADSACRRASGDTAGPRPACSSTNRSASQRRQHCTTCTRGPFIYEGHYRRKHMARMDVQASHSEL